ncbi:hypothetical protein ZIOFF_054770 [Zingiber officinale]|uniref:Uncharacterized protein n=1 Tax=Zingiber officinale TaxID=94328 RepID=A0A8J5KRD6_ZINOF|nr:hypothetical protein ZIOFF_054770 [Zingiber officinale]
MCFLSVDSPIPPSDKIGVKSVQREKEEVIPMKTMKMAWIPYIPLEDRLSQVDRLKTQIFTMACTQRRYCNEFTFLFDFFCSALKALLMLQCCFWHPSCGDPLDLQSLKADEDEDDTVVNIMFPLEPPIVCDYDWEMYEIEEFTDNLIMEETLSEDKKDEFKQENRPSKTWTQRREAMENMKLYKFYPVPTLDTPDISHVKGLRRQCEQISSSVDLQTLAWDWEFEASCGFEYDLRTCWAVVCLGTAQ